MERFKKMINLAKLEWIPKNPFNQFQLKFDKFDRQFLTERELELIENAHYTNERLERIHPTKCILLNSFETNVLFLALACFTCSFSKSCIPSVFDPNILKGFKCEFLYVEPVGYLYRFWKAFSGDGLHGVCHIQGNFLHFSPFGGRYL